MVIKVLRVLRMNGRSQGKRLEVEEKKMGSTSKRPNVLIMLLLFFPSRDCQKNFDDNVCL